nr:MAG TPA: hypothetical protein [Caudoviricetes sp.]
MDTIIFQKSYILMCESKLFIFLVYAILSRLA